MAVETGLEELVISGAAILGACADADLAPECFRVWGAVYDERSNRLRVMANADASRTRECVRQGSRIAVTFTDIVTFRSLQVKGSAVGPPSIPGPADIAVMQHYSNAFIARLAEVGHPAALGEHMRPTATFALDIDVDERFDQTPGPGAGAVIGAR